MERKFVSWPVHTKILTCSIMMWEGRMKKALHAEMGKSWRWWTGRAGEANGGKSALISNLGKAALKVLHGDEPEMCWQQLTGEPGCRSAETGTARTSRRRRHKCHTHPHPHSAQPLSILDPSFIWFALH